MCLRVLSAGMCTVGVREVVLDLRHAGFTENEPGKMNLTLYI